MVRGLVVIVVMVGLAATAVFGYRWLSQQDSADENAEPASVCYPLRQTCRWQMPEGEAAVAMAPLEGDELQLDITLPGEPDRAMVILTGESMYMGEYPFRMENTGEAGRFRARFVPPFCSTGDDMIWRVNLRVGTETVSTPFRLLFRHTGT
ncbi:hypothetical protein ACFOZ5_08475 [Marinobacter lacisalsi]|uniref:Uncharacterized protein n=1 Tax=Marinobacter lacisalsi TaxID=475979 RepID=A0ABV8QHI8_9GAMM